MVCLRGSGWSWRKYPALLDRLGWLMYNAFLSMGKEEGMVSFYEQVYAVVRRIPSGKVTSYGRIAHMLWAPHASRAVGYALRQLRYLLDQPEYADIPWHRVVNHQGLIRVAAPGDHDPLQVELLRTEGIVFSGPTFQVPMKAYLWEGLSPQEIGELIADTEQRMQKKEAST